MYGASPNIIGITNESPLDVAISVSKTIEIDAVSELLIKYIEIRQHYNHREETNQNQSQHL